MRFNLAVVLAASSVAVASFAQAPPRSPSPASPAPAPASPAPAAPQPSGTPQPYAAEIEKYVADVQKSIQGKEDLPSKEVFKNVKVLGEVPASRLLRTMQAFTRSLGVNCTKCHVPEHWDSEEKDDKEVTRDMMKMTRAINEEYIKNIKAIAEDKPSVSCFTCHRGDQHAGVPHPPRG
jgi:photosynthetic reaction center cytochrome c subunit